MGEADIHDGATNTIETTLQFDPTQMIGIIRRKALIKELADAYHAECLTYCQELLELQKKRDEPRAESRSHEETRIKDTGRPPKRVKRTR
ncbi:hypothetical protein AMTRI_Chr02g211970 [Amborella trichopoda]